MKSRAGSRHGWPRRRVLHPLALDVATMPLVPCAAAGQPDDAPVRPPSAAAGQVTYDPDSDAAYIHVAGLIPAGGVGRTISATSSVHLDFDRKGRLVGIEILGRRLMHPRMLAQARVPRSGRK
jgi:uncharacterized protein YuzE